MAVEDIIGALGVVCPTEAAACDTICQTQIQESMADERVDIASMPAEVQAALTCFGGSLINSQPAELADQGDNGGLLALSVISCSMSRTASLRPCFPPARPPPQVRSVAARVLTPTELTETANAVASALATARAASAQQADAPAPPMAQ